MTKQELMKDFELNIVLDTSHGLTLEDGYLLFASTDGSYHQPLVDLAFWAWCKSRENTLLEQGNGMLVAP